MVQRHPAIHDIDDVVACLTQGRGERLLERCDDIPLSAVLFQSRGFFHDGSVCKEAKPAEFRIDSSFLQATTKYVALLVEAQVLAHTVKW